MMQITQPTHATSELAWIRLMNVYLQIDRRSAAVMREHGLSVSRFDVLMQAGAREGKSQQELADALFVTKGNVCQLLDSMEADGLLFRRRQGRTNLIFLTDEGRKLREASLQDQLQNIEHSLISLTREEQQQLLTLLRKVDRGLRSNSKQGY